MLLADSGMLLVVLSEDNEWMSLLNVSCSMKPRLQKANITPAAGVTVSRQHAFLTILHVRQ